ncbi:MAG: PD40 domain-containing protein [Gemmatimonadota bacterium]|nr:MAG: PD40 domain-containing protein [Gemmatimonadota bacterium]
MKVKRCLVTVSALFLLIPNWNCDLSYAQEETKGRIAFYSARNGRDDIYVVDAGGNNLRRLTKGDLEGKCPAFSPDGRLIAFQVSGRGAEDIYLMDADGSNVRRLTDSPASERHAAWSPDGAKIAFVSDRDGNREIYVMNADGSDWRRLTVHPAHEMKPSWSPDGEQIAFNSERDGNWEIYVINTDGTGERRLTNSPEWELFPAWSPDGTRIAFRSGPAGVFQGDIHTINADGTGERKLTHTDGVEEDPQWSPDGRQIVFQSMRDGNFEIYTMDADGGNWRNVTRHPAHDYWPTWGPANTAAPSDTQETGRMSPRDVRLQIVYDDKSYAENLQAAAGFSALVRLKDRTLLFDTGGSGRILLSNMAGVGIDPADIDKILISHNHSDHVGGLPGLLESCERPEVFVVGTLPNNLSGRAEEIVAGAMEAARKHADRVIEISTPAEISNGVYTTGSLGTRIPEHALVVQTQAGLIVITGCAHPGVLELVRRAKESLAQDVLLVIGGFHLGATDPEDIREIVSVLSELTRYVAPCHCSGDVARKLFEEEFGDRYVACGVGEIINLGELASR